MSRNDGFTEFLLDCAPTDVEILGSWNVPDRQDLEVQDLCLRGLTSMTAPPSVLSSATRRAAMAN